MNAGTVEICYYNERGAMPDNVHEPNDQQVADTCSRKPDKVDMDIELWEGVGRGIMMF